MLAFYYEKTLDKARYYFEIYTLLIFDRATPEIINYGTHISHLFYTASATTKNSTKNIPWQNIRDFIKFLSKVPDPDLIFEIDAILFRRIVSNLTANEYKELESLEETIKFVKYLFIF